MQEIAELSRKCSVICYQVGSLDIACVICSCADEVYFRVEEFSNCYFVAEADKVLVDNVFYNLFDVIAIKMPDKFSELLCNSRLCTKFAIDK